jgi:hypothetical protein
MCVAAASLIDERYRRSPRAVCVHDGVAGRVTDRGLRVIVPTPLICVFLRERTFTRSRCDFI